MKACPCANDVGRVAGAAMAGLVVAVALSGCFDPFRVHVPAAVLDASPMEWNVTKGAVHGSTFGAKTTETRYVHLPDDGGPPFPGVLQVFSLRGSQHRDVDDLLDFTRDVVDEALRREGVNVDEDLDAEGRRELRSGLDTQWFTHTGRISETSDDSIFLPSGQEDIVVKVLGEAGYDGRSKTAVVAIAFVQVGRHTQSNLPGVIPSQDVTDERTWFEVVADRQGSIEGATLPSGRGLLTHLRTHG